MPEIMPKGELDITKLKLTPSWFFTAIIMVVVVSAAIGIGLWLYGKGKTMLPTSTAGDF
jgi:hypothetical protein